MGIVDRNALRKRSRYRTRVGIVWVVVAALIALGVLMYSSESMGIREWFGVLLWAAGAAAGSSLWWYLEDLGFR